MTATLNCRGLRKTYPGQAGYALGPDPEGVSIEAERGELFALLGPSGCGKTTTLRIIGGFVNADAGTVEIEGKDVSGLRPYQRPTNTVFQGYALFPHMSIENNVGFGLKMDGVGKSERKKRVAKALELVGLEEFGKRKVAELSGGQAQRAALARAMIKEPSVLLLDEPLGALDLKLRRQMQEELVNLKQRSGTTFVHVTHDQEEACAIADRVAVMNAGRVVQVDSPVELFRAPKTAYVAEFINAGTVIRGSSSQSGDVFEVAGNQMRVRGRAPSRISGSRACAAVLSPAHLRVAPSAHAGSAPNGGDGDQVAGQVDRLVFNGSTHEVHVQTDGGVDLRVDLPLGGNEDLENGSLTPGRPVTVSWRPEDVIFVVDDGVAPTAEEEEEIEIREAV
ncbi:MAG: ABC transporter ATP-binding protein [Solirubrobacterales bacterium]|nr:ABC transporter ATP-binding protein [Solirubrobacterales bacterium]